MKGVPRLAGPVIGLLLAAAAASVAVRSWLAERAHADGVAAQGSGDLRGAAAAFARSRALGGVDGTLGLARLAHLRRAWDDAERLAAEAMAAAPTRAYPHVLLASTLLARPGAWDRAREERVLGACRAAALLEPAAWSLRSECGGILLDLAAGRQASWDAARRAAVRGEAVEAFAAALATGTRLEPYQAGVHPDRRPSRLALAAASAHGADGEMLAEIRRVAGLD